MRMSSALSFLVATCLLAACQGATVKLDDDTGSSIDENGGGNGEDSSGGDTADSGDGADTGETDDTAAAATFSDLTAQVHPVMGSIIVLTWSQTGTASVHAEYSVGDGEWLQTPTYTTSDGARRLLLLGIPFAADVTWRLVADGTPVAADATITTDNLPNGFPTPDVITGTGLDDATPYMLLSLAPQSGGSARSWSFIVDRKARVVWADETPSARVTFMPLVSVDGSSFLLDRNSWWGAFDGGVNSQIERVDIEGTVLDTYDTPGLIHPFTELGDGSLVWGASLGGRSGSGENLDIRDPDGTVRTLLDCGAFVRLHGEADCGSNALDWDPVTNHIYFSLFSIETILDVDLDGTPTRWFGHMDGSYAFTDPDTTFYWQHGGHILDNGHLLVSTRVDASTEETVAREYEIDEGNRALTEVWSFGEGEGVWAYVLGEARRLEGGNTLENYGYEPRMREATPSGELVWVVTWNDAETIGRMNPIEDLYAFWGDAP